MKTIILIIFTIISINTNIKASICTAVNNNGAWNTPATWSCGREPQGGDTIIIPQNIIINITSDVTLTSPPILLNIFGTLSFNTGRKIVLPDNSTIYISSTGSIQKGTGGGSSNLITIGTTDVWKASDGSFNGALYLTKDCNYTNNCISLSNIIFTIKKINNDINLYYYNSDIGTITFQKSYDLITWYDITSIVSNESIYLDKDENSIVYYRAKFENNDVTYTEIKNILNNNIVFNVFPNPSNSEVFFHNNNNLFFNIIIYNSNGTTYLEMYTDNLILNFERGIYYYNIFMGDESYKGKLVIQ